MKTLLFLMIILSSCTNEIAWHGGADNNKNGVRDDIDKWLDDSFSTDKRLYAAMKNLASKDPALCDYKYHIRCLTMVSEEAINLQLSLLEKLLNTDDRRLSFEKRVENCQAKDDRNINLKCDF